MVTCLLLWCTCTCRLELVLIQESFEVYHQHQGEQYNNIPEVSLSLCVMFIAMKRTDHIHTLAPCACACVCVCVCVCVCTCACVCVCVCIWLCMCEYRSIHPRTFPESLCASTCSHTPAMKLYHLQLQTSPINHSLPGKGHSYYQINLVGHFA